MKDILSVVAIVGVLFLLAHYGQASQAPRDHAYATVVAPF